MAAEWSLWWAEGTQSHIVCECVWETNEWQYIWEFRGHSYPAWGHHHIITAPAGFHSQMFALNHKVGIIVSFPELWCEVNKRNKLNKSGSIFSVLQRKCFLSMKQWNNIHHRGHNTDCTTEVINVHPKNNNCSKTSSPLLIGIFFQAWGLWWTEGLH